MKAICTAKRRRKKGTKYFHHFSIGTFARLHMTGRFVVGQRMFENPSPY
ncbi:MAG: hypothetical protein LUB57_07715 [Cloacibacillus porcorum]|nr:hypothetical protein [Cloacibacillus porcorum]